MWRRHKLLSLLLGILLVSLLLARLSHAAISANSLTSGSVENAATTQDTASVTPTAMALVVVGIGFERVGGSSTVVSSLSGNGLTWALIASHEAETRSVSVWRSMGPAPTAGAITITFSDSSANEVAWSVVEFTGVNGSGANGVNAVRQGTANSGGPGTTASVTLAAFASASNGTYGATTIAATVSSTEGSGFTELHDIAVQTPSFATQWRADNDTSVDRTWTGNANWGMVAFEIVASTDPGGSPDVISQGTASATAVGASATVTDATPTLMGSIAANDIVFIQAMTHVTGTGPTLGTINTPSGWTEAAQVTTNDAATVKGRAALFWKRMAGGESGTVTISATSASGSGGAGLFYAQCYRVAPVRTSGDPYESIATNTGTATTLTWNAVTVSGTERTLLAFVAQNDDTPGAGVISTYTRNLAIQTTTSGPDGQLDLQHLRNVSSDGSVTATSGESAGWGTFHLSVTVEAAAATAAGRLHLLGVGK